MTIQFFVHVYHRPHTTVMKIGDKILESPEVKFMNLAPYVFDEDLVAKIRSGLSITILEKKNHKIIEKITA